MSKASETLREVKRQRNSAIKALKELLDMYDGDGCTPCLWCARLCDSANCPADCTKENDRPAWEFGGTMEEASSNAERRESHNISKECAE